MDKLFTEELALQLTTMLLQNDKSIQDDLQSKINNITTSSVITLSRTENDDGVIITVTNDHETNSVVIYDGVDGNNGKNVQVAKIEPIIGGSKVTFSYYDDNSAPQTSSLEVMNGERGVSVSNARVDVGNILILGLSDGTEISAGKIDINIDYDQITLENYYNKNEIDEKFETQYIELDQLISQKLDDSISIASSDDINNLF